MDKLRKGVSVRLENVKRTHKLGDTSVFALKGVDINIKEGEFVALVGPSGCGKSTLLSLIGGMDRPTEGKVAIGDTNLHTLTDKELADYRLEKVGMVFQSFNLIPALNALDNVALPMALSGMNKKERFLQSSNLLEKVGLKDRLNHRPSRLSGGEQQRVSVARALANNPGLLLADEPTGNLDSVAGENVMDLISSLHKEGATVVMVTHDKEIAKKAQRIITMKDGMILKDSRNQSLPPLSSSRFAKAKRMQVWNALIMGASSVRRRKLRTALSSSGVAVGIIAVTLIVSLATGVQSSLLGALAKSGQVNNVTVSNNRDITKYKPLDKSTLSDLSSLPHVVKAYGEVVMLGSSEIDGQSLPAVGLIAQSPLSELPGFASKFLSAGRFQESDSSLEAVVTYSLADKLKLKPTQLINKSITYKAVYSGIPNPSSGLTPAMVQYPLILKIVGVTSKDVSNGDNIGMTAPYNTTLSYWDKMASANSWKGDEFADLTLKADTSNNTDKIRDEVRKKGYTANDVSDFLKQFAQVLLFLELALSAFGGISLFVAALGIANTMYTAVLERTREIGILKALGASNSNVRNLFTAEAGFIGAIGGIIGVIITLLLSYIGNIVVNNIAKNGGFGLELQVFVVPFWLILGAILGAALLSAIAGLLPAINASRLNVVNALRYE